MNEHTAVKQKVITAANYLRSSVSEHRLQTLVMQHIELHGGLYYAFAIPNAARRNPLLASRMKAEGLRAGVADICVMMPKGQCGWLELKAGTKGRQSDAQKGFEAICKRLGHDYELARSLDEAIAILKRWGALK